jgi:hypothetical protein
VSGKIRTAAAAASRKRFVMTNSFAWGRSSQA